MSAVSQFRGVSPWRQTYWDIRAVGNFVGGGTGTGFLLAAALAALAGAPFQILALVGLAFVGGGLTCVWLEIGRPWRAWNVFFNPRTSWMSREAVLAPLLFALGLAAVLFDSVVALVAAAVVGLGFLYCQARILKAAKGIPAWRQPQIVPLIVGSGLAEGAGLFLLAATVVLGFAPLLVGVLALVVVGVRFYALRAYLEPLLAGGAPKAAAKALKRVALPLELTHGVAASLLLLGLALGGLPGSIAMAAGGVVALGAGWWLKYTIIVDAAYTQGYAVTRTPARGRGGVVPGGKPGW